jgi:monofunctional biosynthetic peptidoglycan transglycosylase
MAENRKSRARIGPILTLVILIVLGGVALLFRMVPDVSVLKTEYPVVNYRGKAEPPRVTLSKGRPREWVPLGEISKAAVGAIVVSEDWAYFQHHGYDPKQMKEAIQVDWEDGSFSRGASTITQQVVRNVFLSKDKHITRKLLELYLAVRLDEHVSKRRVLETYFNIAEWGEGIYGIAGASAFYFGKPPRDLTAKEGAFLAMLLPSPIRYGASFREGHLTDYARETIDSILAKLVQAHYLTEEEHATEVARPLAFER